MSPENTRLADERLAQLVDTQYEVLAVGTWVCALLFYVVGDTGLTMLVIELGGYEVNPVARAFVDAAGYAGLVLQKSVVLGVLVAAWRTFPTVGNWSPDPWRIVVPATAATVGVYLVGEHVENLATLL